MEFGRTSTHPASRSPKYGCAASTLKSKNVAKGSVVIADDGPHCTSDAKSRPVV